MTHPNNDLPDVKEYGLSRSRLPVQPRLKQAIQEHLAGSKVLDVLGQPQPWQLEEKGDLMIATLKWTTPEGWEVTSHPYFTLVDSRDLATRGQKVWYGPWGDGEIIFRSDGYELGDGSNGLNALALDLDNVAYTIEQIRLKPDDWNWPHWYDTSLDDEGKKLGGEEDEEPSFTSTMSAQEFVRQHLDPLVQKAADCGLLLGAVVVGLEETGESNLRIREVARVTQFGTSGSGDSILKDVIGEWRVVE